MKSSETIFYQLFDSESSTYTYLIGDAETKEAALIDTVKECVGRDLKLVTELGLSLKYVLDTHIHADHVTGSGEIRLRTGAKSGISEAAGVECADISLNGGDELFLGQKKIKVLTTPGHTNTCVSFLFGNAVFSGDALLIRATGRTDFQNGSAVNLYHSIKDVLFALPEDTKVYPAHDYHGHTASSIGMEKKFNPRIGADKSESEFIAIMAEVKLADPKKISEAVPANMLCGKVQK